MTGTKRKASPDEELEVIGDTIIVSPSPRRSPPYSWLHSGSPSPSKKTRINTTSPTPDPQDRSGQSASENNQKANLKKPRGPAKTSTSNPTPKMTPLKIAPRPSLATPVLIAPKPSPASPYDISDLDYIRAQPPALQNRLLKEKLALIERAKQQPEGESEKSTVGNEKVIGLETPAIDLDTVTPSSPAQIATVKAQAAAQQATTTPTHKPKAKASRKKAEQEAPASSGTDLTAEEVRELYSVKSTKTPRKKPEPAAAKSSGEGMTPEEVRELYSVKPAAKSTVKAKASQKTSLEPPSAASASNQKTDRTIPPSTAPLGNHEKTLTTGTEASFLNEETSIEQVQSSEEPIPTEAPDPPTSAPTTKKDTPTDNAPSAQKDTPINNAPSAPEETPTIVAPSHQKDTQPEPSNHTRASTHQRPTFTREQDTILRAAYEDLMAEFWGMVALRTKIRGGGEHTSDECERQWAGEEENVQDLLKMFQKPGEK